MSSERVGRGQQRIKRDRRAADDERVDELAEHREQRRERHAAELRQQGQWVKGRRR